MANLLPFLELRDTASGRCVRLIDNCLTLALLRGHYGAQIDDCDNCCPTCEQEREFIGDANQDGAFWASDVDPVSNGFFGMLTNEVWLEPSASIRRRGETTADRPPWTPRQLKIYGTLLGDSTAATYFGEVAFLKLLSSECGPCDGWEASLRLFCPEFEVANPIPPQLWEPDDPPPLVGDPDECEPCANQDPDWEPQLLEPPPPERPTSIDSGRRNIMRLRFVSLDEDLDNDTPTPYCMGQNVVITFEVLDDYEWGDPIEDVCQLDRGFDTIDSGRCRPHDWTSCLTIPNQESCVSEHEARRSTASLAEVEAPRSARRRQTQYCQPLYRSVRSCLTPILPTAAEVALEVAIWSGSEDLENFRIDLWPAFEGVPSPETCEGESIYQRMVPCGSLHVPFVPANSWLILDGRRGETWLHCANREPEKANGWIENWSHQLFDPACRMWVSAIADCYNTAEDALVEIVYHPRYQS